MVIKERPDLEPRLGEVRIRLEAPCVRPRYRCPQGRPGALRGQFGARIVFEL